MKNFKNKVVVITGAASGLGRELAIAGAELGLNLVLADVQFDELNLLKNKLEESDAKVVVSRCDVSKSEDVKALADTAVKEFGMVNLLFNNAGVSTSGFVWENSLSDWDWLLGVNLWGVIHGIREFVPLMIEFAKRDEFYEGHVINTASIAGLLNTPTMGIYNASKHAIVSISESLYHDLQLIKSRVGCSVLCPFFMPTAIAQADRHRPIHLQNDMPVSVSQRLFQEINEKAVTEGTATPRQVAIKTYDAILNGQFYIYSDTNPLSDIQTRMEDILKERNPSDPYVNLPEVKKFIEVKLRRVIR